MAINDMALAALDQAIAENYEIGLTHMRNTSGQLHKEWVGVMGFCDKPNCQDCTKLSKERNG